MALAAGTFSSIGGAVGDLFAASAYKTRAKGNLLQADEYNLARDLSVENKQFTETSTAIKEQQQQRSVDAVLGEQRADVAGSGFESSGSALDLLRDSASQGALTKQVLGAQGQIEEAGYEEQAKSYGLMAQSAQMAAQADQKAAKGATISAIFKGVTAVASLFSGGFGGGGGGAGGAGLDAIGGGIGGA